MGFKNFKDIGTKITGVTDPTADQDAATKKYVEDNFATTSALGSYVTSTSLNSTLGSYVTSTSLNSTLGSYLTSTAAASTYATTAALNSAIEGLSPKEAVRLATTANISATAAATTLTTSATSLTIDGAAVVNGDRVLVKDQTAKKENGIYVVSGVGSAVVLTRAADFDDEAAILGAYIFATDGTANEGKGFILTSPDAGDSITVSGASGGSDLEFSTFTSSGGASALNDLSDATVSSASQDDVLVANSSGVFVNTAKSSFLSGYATTSDLGSYVTSTSLNSTLGSYVTSTSLNSTLGSYLTSSTAASTYAAKGSNSDITGLSGLTVGVPRVPDSSEITSSATLAANKDLHVVNTSSNITVTLPSTYVGITRIVKTLGTGTITIARASASDYIDGAQADITIDVAGESVTLVSDFICPLVGLSVAPPIETWVDVSFSVNLVVAMHA